MVDNQHTPGPWVIQPETLGEHSIVTPDGRDLIADIYGQSPANARLIAAAPDLLEALQDLAEEAGRFVYPQPDKPHSAWAKLVRARAAIAKATGA